MESGVDTAGDFAQVTLELICFCVMKSTFVQRLSKRDELNSNVKVPELEKFVSGHMQASEELLEGPGGSWRIRRILEGPGGS